MWMLYGKDGVQQWTVYQTCFWKSWFGNVSRHWRWCWAAMGRNWYFPWLFQIQRKTVYERAGLSKWVFAPLTCSIQIRIVISVKQHQQTCLVKMFGKRLKRELWRLVQESVSSASLSFIEPHHTVLCVGKIIRESTNWQVSSLWNCERKLCEGSNPSSRAGILFLWSRETSSVRTLRACKTRPEKTDGGILVLAAGSRKR